MRSLLTMVFALSLVPATLLAADPKPTRHDVPMVDGVKLATDVYLPQGDEGRWPAILILTPYGRSGAKGFAKQFVEKGYAVVSQDIRGRGDSEGSNVVIFQSGGWTGPRDGHVTLQWIADQPWSNGKIATWGGSAVGITQNMLAPDAPEFLKGQFVEVASGNLYAECMYLSGAFRKEMIEGWLAATGMTKGNLDTFRAHPAYDDFWETMNPRKFADRTVAPAIYIGGWYDIFCQGTIDSFLATQEKGGPAARGQCRLVMGPWAHGPFNELKYPPQGNKRPEAVDAGRFFDFHLQGKANGVDQDKPVHYFVMGDPEDPDAPGNEWRSADSWPPASVGTPFYLTSDGSISREAPSSPAERTYAHDPAHPVPTIGGQNLIIAKGPMDQRSVEDRPDVLIFTTPVLAEPIEITGRITAKLFVASDATDTDFVVKLMDVYPDGRSMLVTDGILRARYRKSFSEPEFLTAGETYEIAVDLWSTSLILNKGHSLRIAIASSNHPRFDVNPGTGKNSWEETSPRVAHNTIHFGADRASRILLPIVDSAMLKTALKSADRPVDGSAQGGK